MRKTICILITLALILCLSACGETQKENDNNSSSEQGLVSQTESINTSNDATTNNDSIVEIDTPANTPNNQYSNPQQNVSSTHTNKDNSTSTTSSKEQAASTATTSSAQNNSQSSTNLQQKITEENARHGNVIKELNQKKQDILSLRDARFNALGTAYSGTEEEYLAKQSEWRNRSNKLQFFISSCRGSNLSQSTQKKLREAQKEKEAVDAELSALEKAMSVKRLKQDIENQTKTQIDDVEKEIQAENDLYARNLALLK